MLWQVPDAALIGNAFFIDTRLVGETTNIAFNIEMVMTGGYADTSDGGGGLFKRVAGPLSDSASFQSLDGAWWQLVSNPVNIRQFGATCDGSDDTAAVQACLDYGYPIDASGSFNSTIDSVTGNNIIMFGDGLGGFTKLAGTKGEMFDLTGHNIIKDIVIDYNWENALQTLPYNSNICVRQTNGSIAINGVTFKRTFTAACILEGCNIDINLCNFIEGAPNNDLSGGDERPTYYLAIFADGDTQEQTCNITNCTFVGPYFDNNDLYLNTTGVFITASSLDGVRYKQVLIDGNSFTGCGQNAGAGNVTGAIDTYNGVANCIISNNTIRKASYAGIKVQNSSQVSITGNVIVDTFASASAYDAQQFGITTTEKARGSVDDQTNIVIANNVIKSSKYMAIQNSCDNCVIMGNTIDGVELTTQGEGIYNVGNNVNIIGNVLKDVAGYCVMSLDADNVNIIGNISNNVAFNGNGGVFLTGSNANISDNNITYNSTIAGPGVRINGTTSNVRLIGNLLSGVTNGIDIRDDGGTTDNVYLSGNQFGTIAVSNVVIEATVTNAYVEPNFRVKVSALFDPPLINAGACSAVQTVACPGAIVGDCVSVGPVRDMMGFITQAWISSADTISYMLINPAGNPAGNVDLGNTQFLFYVFRAD
jgi:parallel beta-helix repeat protein